MNQGLAVVQAVWGGQKALRKRSVEWVQNEPHVINAMFQSGP